jgi:hypothetical protein
MRCHTLLKPRKPVLDVRLPTVATKASLDLARTRRTRIVTLGPSAQLPVVLIALRVAGLRRDGERFKRFHPCRGFRPWAGGGPAGSVPPGRAPLSTDCSVGNCPRLWVAQPFDHRLDEFRCRSSTCPRWQGQEGGTNSDQWARRATGARSSVSRGPRLGENLEFGGRGMLVDGGADRPQGLGERRPTLLEA